MMTENNDYLFWLEKGDRIRISARAIIFDMRQARILVEKNVEIDSPFFNFIGGGLEVGESMMACMRRELSEETNAMIAGSPDQVVGAQHRLQRTSLRPPLMACNAFPASARSCIRVLPEPPWCLSHTVGWLHVKYDQGRSNQHE